MAREEEISELITQALKGSAGFETVETLVRDGIGSSRSAPLQS